MGTLPPAAAGQPLLVIEPDNLYAAAFLEMAREFQAAGEAQYEKDLPLLQMNFPAFIERLRKNARGESLPLGHVSGNEYWLLDCSLGRILGAIHLRHRLTPYLEERGGHIGYAIRPAERRKGYGTRMLATLLTWLRDPAWQAARGLDLHRVLVTCNTDNIASARVIEANGGVLENRVWSEGELISRYWIDLEAGRKNGAHDQPG